MCVLCVLDFTKRERENVNWRERERERLIIINTDRNFHIESVAALSVSLKHSAIDNS